LGSREIAHAVRYGTVDHDTDAFIPARDSAPTVICQLCGEILLKLVYQKFNPVSNPYKQF